MAKVTGPLMSMTASGAFGGTLVFANRLGSNVVRQLVTPANPRSVGQTDARNIQRVAAACQAQANAMTAINSTLTLRDKAEIAAITPSGQRWNSYFSQAIIGAGQVTYDAAVAAWGALSAPQKTAWEDAAAALTPAFPDVAQKVAVTNATGTPISNGQAWYIYQYGLYSLGLVALPAGTPPTYA
jgi:hypothetical protein